MDIQKLLTKLIDWFLGQSKQRTETLILEEFSAPGVRLIKLRRKTCRAAATWKALFYVDRFDLDVGLDTLEFVPNCTPIEFKNKLSTHAINIVRVWYDTVVDSETGQRKIRKDVLLSSECCLIAAYSTKSYAVTITDEFAKLLLKPQYHPSEVDLKAIFEQVAQHYLGKRHQVFPPTSD